MIVRFIKNKIKCIREGHAYAKDGDTLGGDFIRCIRCKRSDEFLPGLHEPKGYDSKKIYIAERAIFEMNEIFNYYQEVIEKEHHRASSYQKRYRDWY